MPTVARVTARETFFSIRSRSTPMCEHFKWEAHDDGKCKKRHRSVYKLDAVREPVGFKMVVPPRRRRTKKSGESGAGPLDYLLSPRTIQAINNNLHCLLPKLPE